MTVSPQDMRSIKQQLAEKHATEVCRLMTDFTTWQPRNVRTAIGLMEKVKHAKPTRLTTRARQLFEDAEVIAGVFADHTEGVTVNVDSKELGLLNVLANLWLVQVYADAANLDGPNGQRISHEIIRMGDQNQTGITDTPEQAEKAMAVDRDVVVALIRRYFTPRPRWWTKAVDNMLDRKQTKNAAYARTPNGCKMTDERWTNYDATCAQAAIDNPDLAMIMEGHRIRHAEAYARDPSGFWMTPDEWLENDRLNEEARRALAKRNQEKQRNCEIS